MKIQNMKLSLLMLGLLLTQISQATVFYLFNATNDPIQTWVNCNLIHDSKNRPYTIYPQFRLSIPFIQKPLCNIGSRDWQNGFFWKDSQERVWKANEVTSFEMLGNDLYIISGDGLYTRIIFPSGMPLVDIGRFIGEKIVDLVNAIKNNIPLDTFFKTIGIPGVSVATGLKAQQIEDPSKLY